MNALRYALNTQVHHTTKLAPLAVVLSLPPPHLALEDKPDLEDNFSTKDFRIICLSLLRSPMATSKDYMHSTQFGISAPVTRELKSLDEN